MNIKVQFMLEANPFLKKYLREHSWLYKDIIRNPQVINELESLMKKEYGLTFPDKLEKVKNNIAMINSFMDIIK